MNAQKTIFAGTLRKGHISYYFEVKETAVFAPEENVYMPETDVYIEKNDHSKNDSAINHGHFSIEEGRRCYKALLIKGYKVVDESLA